MAKAVTDAATKSERIANQANYLLTVATTAAAAGMITTAIATGHVPDIWLPVGVLWAMAFIARTVDALVRSHITAEQKRTDAEVAQPQKELK